MVRLRLIGAGLFVKDARRAERALRELGGAGRTSGRSLSGISTQSRGAQRSFKGIHAAALGAAGALARFAGGAAAAGGVGGGIAVAQAANYEQAMAVVQSRLLTTGENMKRLDALAMKLGATTNFSAGEAADAMGELAAAGFDTQQILSVLPGTLALAAASGTDLANAAQIQTETLNGFGLSASKAGHVADVLAQIANRSAAGIDDMQEALKYIAPVAKASGQSLQDMGAAVGLMSNVGIKGSQAGTTLRTAMVRLANPTDKARSALKTLGLSAGDLAGKNGLLSLPNIMQKLSAGARGVSKNQRNAAIATIFGREALSGMVTLVEKGPAKLRKLSDELRNSAGASKRAADIQRNTVKGAFDNLTGSIETAGIKLTKRFMPAIRNALNTGATAVNAFVQGISGGLQTPLSGAAGVAQRFGQILRSAIGWMIKTAPKAFAAVSGVATQLIDAFRPALPFVRNVLLPLVKGIAIGIGVTLVGMFKIAVVAIRVLSTALGWVGQKLEPLRGVFTGVGVVIGALVGGPILKALSFVPKLGVVFNVVGRAMGAFASVIGRVIGFGARLLAPFLRVAGFLAGKWLAVHKLAWGTVIRTAVGAGGRVIGLLTRMWGGVKKVIGWVGKLGGAFKRAFSGLAGIVRGAFSGVIGAITTAVNSAIDVINAVIRGYNDTAGRIPGVPNIDELGHLGANAAGAPRNNNASVRPSTATGGAPSPRADLRRERVGGPKANAASLGFNRVIVRPSFVVQQNERGTWGVVHREERRLAETR